MKTIILAGGLGTRLSELTETVPKPMVLINDKPIIKHIMEIYENQSFNEFIIASGYKHEKVVDYFRSLLTNSNEVKFDYSSGTLNENKNLMNLKVDVIFTGELTMTGGRVKRILEKYDDENFFLTYGDGLSSVDLKKLLEIHEKNKALVTITCINPASRYGQIKFSDTVSNKIDEFQEKSSFQKNWINGGFMVINRKVLEFLNNDDAVFEKDVLENPKVISRMYSLQHTGFWYCMDSLREYNYLNKITKKGDKPWIKK